MNQVVLFLLLAITAGLTLDMLFVGLNAFFYKFVHGIQDAVDANPGRSILIGLINTLFFLAIGYLLVAWAQSAGLALIGFFGALFWIALAMGLVFGLTGMVLSARARLTPGEETWRSIASAGAILILASLTPYIGWFLFFPYLLLRGLGGVVIHLQAAYRRRRSEGE
jgi:hypothetical protein